MDNEDRVTHNEKDLGEGVIYNKITRRSGWVRWDDGTYTLEMFKNLTFVGGEDV